MVNNISSVMDELEIKRKKINTFNILVAGAFAGLFLSQMLLPIIMDGDLVSTFIPLCYIAFILLLFIGGAKNSKDKKEFKRLYKATFVEGVLQQTFDNVVYTPEMGYDRTTVGDMGLSALGNRFYSEDYLRGSYKGVNFSQADVTIKDERGSGKNRTVVTYFKGRMFTFDFPKSDVLGVKVFSNNFQHKSSYTNGFKFTKIKLEDVEFNKKFDIKAARDHDAFYVLTPHMMENIKKIRAEYGNVAMFITAGKLHLGFNSTRDTFDASTRKPLSYPDECAKINKDVHVIKDIIEVMQLEN